MTLQIKTLIGRMTLLGVSQAALCSLTFLRPNQLSPIFRGLQNLDAVTFHKIDAALTELESLVQRARPFAIDFADARTTRFLLEKQRLGEFDAYPTDHAKELIAELAERERRESRL